MELAHVHLMLNHVPLLGTFFAACLLLWALVRKNDALKHLGAVILVISALVTIPVYFTGEPAEEKVEHLPGVERSIIHEHEEAGEAGIIVMSVIGAIALVSMVLVRRTPATLTRWSVILLVASLFSFSVMARVAYLGGQVMHPELRSGPSQQPILDHE